MLHLVRKHFLYYVGIAEEYIDTFLYYVGIAEEYIVMLHMQILLLKSYTLHATFQISTQLDVQQCVTQKPGINIILNSFICDINNRWTLQEHYHNQL